MLKLLIFALVELSLPLRQLRKKKDKEERQRKQKHQLQGFLPLIDSRT